MKNSSKENNLLFLLLITLPFILSNIIWYLNSQIQNTLLLFLSLGVSFLLSYIFYKKLMLNKVSKEKELGEMRVDFVSMAVHELRTPVTAIRGYSKILNEEIKEKLNKEQQEFLERIINSVINLNALVDNLLNASRIEKGTLQLDLRIIQLENLVENTVQNLVQIAKSKNQKLTSKIPVDKFPPVLIDKFRIEEVLNNLITNAMNYTPIGGSIMVSMELKNSQVITSIIDTGEGISKDSASKLFTKFFRAGGKMEPASKGTGLGLFLSRQIIELHKGKIWVESTLGKGSTFFFSLPIANDVEIKNAANEEHTEATKGFFLNPARNK